METRLLQPDERGITLAAKLLRVGELVAIPTETVYGLAANALDPVAVGKIFTAKGRPQDNPLIVHISHMGMLDLLVREVPPLAAVLAKAFWPGPLTMVLPKSARIPSAVSAGLDTVGIRMPSHPVARAVIDACALPLAAPSANASSRPSPTRASHVYDDLHGKIPLILDGGPCEFGLESTVLSIIGETAHILRPGAVTAEQIAALGAKVEMDEAVTKPYTGKAAASPGMKYKHYAPNARVIMVKGACERFIEYVKAQPQGQDVYCLVFDSDVGIPVPFLTYGDTAPEQASLLFARLRELDGLGAKTVYARCPSDQGIGLAVYNRLIRAAGFEVITLE